MQNIVLRNVAASLRAANQLRCSVPVRCLATVKDIFPNKVDFPSRHIGPRKTDVVEMLDLLGYKVNKLLLWCRQKINMNAFLFMLQSLDELSNDAVPKQIQLKRELVIEEALSKYICHILIAKCYCWKFSNKNLFIFWDEFLLLSSHIIM